MGYLSLQKRERLYLKITRVLQMTDFLPNFRPKSPNGKVEPILVQHLLTLSYGSLLLAADRVIRKDVYPSGGAGMAGLLQQEVAYLRCILSPG